MTALELICAGVRVSGSGVDAWSGAIGKKLKDPLGGRQLLGSALMVIALVLVLI